MTKKRVSILLCLIWIIGAMTFLVVRVNTSRAGEVYSTESDCLEGTETVYVTDNSSGNGIVYSLSSEGKVKQCYSSAGKSYIGSWRTEDICRKVTAEDGDSVYVLFVDGDPSQETFRIVEFSSNLVRMSISLPYQLPDNTSVEALSVTDESFFVTGIGEDRRDVSVYELPVSCLVDLGSVTKEEKKTLSDTAAVLEESMHENAKEGRYYADADYAEGILYTRMDGAAPEGYFSENEAVRELFDNRDQSFWQNVMVSGGFSPFYSAAIILAGAAIIVLLVHVLASNQRMIVRIISYELCLLGVLLAANSIVLFNVNTALTQSYVRFAEFSLDTLGQTIWMVASDAKSVYDTDVYPAVLSEMERLADHGNQMVTVRDVFMVNTKTGVISASLKGYSEENIDYTYGREALAIVTGQQSNDGEKIKIGDEEFILLMDNSTGIDDTAVVSIAKHDTIFSYILHNRLDFFLLLLFSFLLFSVIGDVFLVREGRDLAALRKALEKLAEGREDIKKPKHLSGWDMNRMWNSIQEIRRSLLTERNSRYRLYEAYYRFAPKDVERILQKESITDVKSGDTTHVSGTLSYVTTGGGLSGENGLDSKNIFLGLLEKIRERTDGILVSNDTDLSSLEVLFLEGSTKSVRFAVDLLIESRGLPKAMKLPRVSLFLHHDDFLYGVMGTDQHVSTFLSAPHIDRLQKYAAWFSELGVGIVVTEKVKEREASPFAMRFIGFITPGRNAGEKTKLYEVLDAEDPQIRKSKENTAEDFEKGLSLFYRKDFYLARNVFTEIARISPRDGIAKWYLFECEHYLNEMDPTQFVGNLHMTKEG